MMKNIACICLCLLLLGTSGLGQEIGNVTAEETVDEFAERTGCTQQEYAERTQELGSYMLNNCPLYHTFMSKYESHPIIADAGMPKEQVCSTPAHIADCAQAYIEALPCFKEDYKMVLYMEFNITLKVAEVYCANYEEIQTAQQQGLLSCSGVTRTDLKNKIKSCVEEDSGIDDQDGFCTATSTALRCIRKRAFADCSSSLKVHAKEFLQKVMDAMDMCPHVQI